MNQFESVSVWFLLSNFDFNDLSSRRFDDFAIYQIHDFISAMVSTTLTWKGWLDRKKDQIRDQTPDDWARDKAAPSCLRDTPGIRPVDRIHACMPEGKMNYNKTKPSLRSLRPEGVTSQVWRDSVKYNTSA